jgi:hypothetical protein
MQDTLRKARTALRSAHARTSAPHRPSPAQMHEASERAAELDSAYLMSSMERMRAKCTVPRDVVMVYESLNKVGLQYGPAFRLLTDVYVPEGVASAQAAAHQAH